MPSGDDAYRAKRRFDRTPEPIGGAGGGEGWLFAVHKHQSRRPHYDLRLQIGDSLKSWAVPEGPCLDPKIRRFAVEVEEHPLDYAAFEGMIPDGNYGAGQTIVWDRGAWVTLEDPATALRKGEIKFRLAGSKLGGGWMLKRLPANPSHWLLIKERDIAARSLEIYDVLIAAPDSVISGRPIEDPPPRAKSPARRRPAQIRGAVAGPFPVQWRPQLASLAPSAPPAAGWIPRNQI